MGIRKARESLTPQEAREVAILDDIAFELVRKLKTPEAKQTRILKNLPFPVIDLDTSGAKDDAEIFRATLQELFYKRLTHSEWFVHEEIQSWLLDTWTATVSSTLLDIGLDPVLGVPVAFTRTKLPNKAKLEGLEGLSLKLPSDDYVDDYGIDYSFITWEKTPVLSIGPFRLVRISCSDSSNINWATARAGSSDCVHLMPDGADVQVLRPGRIVKQGEQLRVWFGPSYDDECTCGNHIVEAPVDEPSPVPPPPVVERSPSPAPVLLRRDSGESSRPKRPSPPKRDSLSARRLAARRVMSASPTPSEVATPAEDQASRPQNAEYSPPSPPASSLQLGSGSEPARSVSPVTSTDAGEPQPTFDMPLDAEEYPSFDAPAADHDRQPSIEACLESLEAQAASSPTLVVEALAESVEVEAVPTPAEPAQTTVPTRVEPAQTTPRPDSNTALAHRVSVEPSDEVIVVDERQPVSVALEGENLPGQEAQESPKAVVEEVDAVAPVSVDVNAVPDQDSVEDVADPRHAILEDAPNESGPEPLPEDIEVETPQEPVAVPSPSPPSVVEPQSESTVYETPVSESTSYEEPQVFEPPHASMKLEFLLAPVDEPIRTPETHRRPLVDVYPQPSPSVPSVVMEEATPSPHHSEAESDMDMDDEWDAPTPPAMRTGPEPGSSGGTPLITPNLEAEHTGFPTTDDYGPVNAYLEAENGDDYTPLGTPLADESEVVVTSAAKARRTLRSSDRDHDDWLEAMGNSVAEFAKHTLAARAAQRKELDVDSVGLHVPPPNRVILVDSHHPDESAERFRFHPSLHVSTDKFYSRVKRLQDQSTDLIVTWEYDLGIKKYGPYSS